MFPLELPAGTAFTDLPYTAACERSSPCHRHAPSPLLCLSLSLSHSLTPCRVHTLCSLSFSRSSHFSLSLSLILPPCLSLPNPALPLFRFVFRRRFARRGVSKTAKTPRASVFHRSKVPCNSERFNFIRRDYSSFIFVRGRVYFEDRSRRSSNEHRNGFMVVLRGEGGGRACK